MKSGDPWPFDLALQPESLENVRQIEPPPNADLLQHPVELTNILIGRLGPHCRRYRPRRRG